MKPIMLTGNVNLDDYITLKEAARVTGKEYSTIRAYCYGDKSRFTVYKIMGSTFLSRKELTEYMVKHCA